MALAVFAICGARLAPMGPCPLQPKQPATHSVELVAGELLHVQVEALGVDILLELRRADGTRLVRANERYSGDGVEELSWIPETSEPATLLVRPLAGAGGAYRVLSVERHPATAEDRRRVAAIAEALAMQELYAAATAEASRELADKGAEVAERLFAAGFPERALRVLHDRARGLREDLGDHQAATAGFVAVAERAATLDLPVMRADALTWLAIGEKQRGSLARAEVLLGEAISDARRGRDRKVLADTLDVYAGVLDLLGRSRESIGVRQEAIALQSQLGRVESVALARSGLGSTLYRLGELDSAEAELEASVATLRELGKTGALVQVLANLAAVAITKGEAERAAELLEEAVRLEVPLGNRSYTIHALLNLGNAYAELGRVEAAEASARAAENLAREADFPALVALALEDRGERATDRGDFGAAAALFAESEVRSRAVGDLDRVASVLTYSARVLVRRGEHDRALLALEEALAISRTNSYPLRELGARVGIARVARAKGDLDRARDEIRQAIAVLEELRDSLAAVDDRRGFLERQRDAYQLEVGILLDLEHREPGRGHIEAAFAAAERGRSRWLLDLLDQRAAPRPNPSTAAYLDAVAKLRASQRALVGVGDDLPAGDRQRLEHEHGEAVRGFESARAALARTRPRAAEFARTSASADIAELTSGLAPDEALLEYVIGEDVSALFVLREGLLQVFELPPRDQLAELVRGLESEVAKSSVLGAAAFRTRAWQAYQALIEPASAQLAGARRLRIAADGPLHRLAFGLLVESESAGASFSDLAYLIRGREIAIIPSVGVWLSLRRRGLESSDERPAGAAFGDPTLDRGPTASRRGSIFDELTTGGLGALPGSRVEATQVARRLPGMALYLGGEASEARVKQDANVRYGRILHFAAHGLPSDRRPALSALLLAGDAVEDGLLQAWEIEELELSSDLVVLSSCRSALGREVSGEGFVGLVQAFLDAGTRSVVATLDSVDDQAASALMAAFYARIERGDSPATALAVAQRAMLEQGGAAALPRNWAPFVLVGDPGQGPGSSRNAQPAARLGTAQE